MSDLIICSNAKHCPSWNGCRHRKPHFDTNYCFYGPCDHHSGERMVKCIPYIEKVVLPKELFEI